MRRSLKYGLLLAVLALVAAPILGGLWLSRTGAPRRTGEATLAGLEGPVTVRWDDWGVPHVSADRLADLARAMGYLHANDRLTQMELGRRRAAGRLAEVVGEAALPLDRYFRGLGVPEIARAHVTALSTESTMLMEAYAEGVNAWLAERDGDMPPELRVLGVDPEPWTVVDSVYFQIQLSHELSFWAGRPEETRFGWLRALGRDRTAEMIGDPALHVPEEIERLAAATAARTEGPSSTAPIASVFSCPFPCAARRELLSSGPLGSNEWSGPLGSNNWAVAGSRTASGLPIVANDPHLPLALPGTWYEATLRAPDYEAAGLTLPGFPIVVIGQSADLAWGFTNAMLDDHDLFFEELDDGGERVRRGDSWEPIRVDETRIPLASGDSDTLVLRRTDKGPLLDAVPERGLPPRSLQWAAAVPGDNAAVLLRLATVGSIEELRGELEAWVAPAQNLVVADRQGRVMHTVVGRVPMRGRGDGRLPAPGWDPEYDWSGLRPQTLNPTVVDPAAGFLATANHDIRTPGFHGPFLPFVADFDGPHRVDRIRELLGRRDDWTPAEMATTQLDIFSLYAREIVALIEDRYEGFAADAYARLRTWDGAMVLRGPPALFALFERELTERSLGDELADLGFGPMGGRLQLLRLLRGEMSDDWFDDRRTETREDRRTIVAAALEAAWVAARERWGDDIATWDYGELHPLALSNPLAAMPILGGSWSRGPVPMPGSATTVAAFGGGWQDDVQPIRYGPSVRWIADLSDPDRSLVVLPAGQSGHPYDRHYDDQLAAYIGGRHRPVLWSEAAIAAATVSELRLVPGR